jgi:hypothetical protein
MNRAGLLLYRTSLLLLVAATSAAIFTRAQQPHQSAVNPQRLLSMEDEKFAHPVVLPNCARRLLTRNRDVVNVLDNAHPSLKQLPDDWFQASEIERDQGNGRSLVVRGVGGMLGANITPFWVFRWSAKSCALLPSTAAHDLEVLKTRANGLPDIESSAATADRLFQRWGRPLAPFSIRRAAGCGNNGGSRNPPT